ncbi:XdhC family protein [Microbacterium sp. P05]|uniref:XdhC family protein n=1 Tax=Microbacterium sp. P05 TaxID=3366948 RepID=UPI003747342C
MLELARELLPLLRRGEAVAVVTVARVARSAPRGAGAAMAVTGAGEVIGSISGGCVEGDAVLLATEVLATGLPRRATLGFTDDAAHAAGLACGGSVEVIVHRVTPDDEVAIGALEAADADLPTAVGIVLGGAAMGRTVPLEPGAAETTRTLATDMLAVVHLPRPRLVVIGAGEHAMALARVASAAGFFVAVCDVWERLVTPERFPSAELLVVATPADELETLVGASPQRAAVCVLTHDERVDVPAIARALRLGVGFVGALGARSTVAHREVLLRAAGVTDEEVARLRSPLGLDLGGVSPEESAIAALAEIVAARHGGSGAPLRDGDGPLHRRTAAPTCATDFEGAAR